MRKLVEETGCDGLEKLMGEKVTFLCMNYFYYGKLIGVSEHDVLLEDASIVYETGKWDDVNWADAQKVCKELYVRTSTIESYGKIK